MGEGGRDFLKEVVACLLNLLGSSLVMIHRDIGCGTVVVDRCVNMG